MKQRLDLDDKYVILKAKYQRSETQVIALNDELNLTQLKWVFDQIGGGVDIDSWFKDVDLIDED